MAISSGIGSLVKACVLCIIIALCARHTHARPPWLTSGTGVLVASAECHTDDELLDLCQRCAKLTKSPHAYPNCCSADLLARKWCADFVYFGRGYYDYDE